MFPAGFQITSGSPLDHLWRESRREALSTATTLIQTANYFRDRVRLKILFQRDMRMFGDPHYGDTTLTFPGTKERDEPTLGTWNPPLAEGHCLDAPTVETILSDFRRISFLTAF